MKKKSKNIQTWILYPIVLFLSFGSGWLVRGLYTKQQINSIIKQKDSDLTDLMESKTTLQEELLSIRNKPSPTPLIIIKGKDNAVKIKEIDTKITSLKEKRQEWRNLWKTTLDKLNTFSNTGDTYNNLINPIIEKIDQIDNQILLLEQEKRIYE